MRVEVKNVKETRKKRQNQKKLKASVKNSRFFYPFYTNVNEQLADLHPFNL